MKTRNYQDDCIVCGKNKILNRNNISEYDYDIYLLMVKFKINKNYYD